jgi:sugar phosphate isomerase/epimerase
VTSYRLCLSESRSPSATLEEDLSIANEAGLTCIDLWSPKLDEYLATYPIVWLDMKLREHQVYPAAVSGVELAVRTTREQDLIDQAHFLELCTHVDALGGGIIVVHPRVQNRDGHAEVEAASAQIVPMTVRALRAYADLAAPFDVHVAFEFRSDAYSAVRTLAASQEIVQQVSRSNVGLSLSTLNMYESGVTPEELDALDMGRLKLVHLEGALSPPLRAQEKAGESATCALLPHGMPGQEESFLQVICGHLAAYGFRGPYSIACPATQEADDLAPGSQASPLERALEAKQAALDLLTPLYL